MGYCRHAVLAKLFAHCTCIAALTAHAPGRHGCNDHVVICRDCRATKQAKKPSHGAEAYGHILPCCNSQQSSYLAVPDHDHIAVHLVKLMLECSMLQYSAYTQAGLVSG